MVSLLVVQTGFTDPVRRLGPRGHPHGPLLVAGTDTAAARYLEVTTAMHGEPPGWTGESTWHLGIPRW